MVIRSVASCWILGCWVAGLLLAQGSAQDITGLWSGTAETTDEGGTKRQEKQSLEIRRATDGKLTGNRIDKSGKPGLQLDVQQSGAKVNVYVYLDFEGGEPLRWKLEWKEGTLAGTFSAQHHNPAKWVYDRVGPVTLSRQSR